MKSPNELSFLPDDYLERKAQRRTNAICATLFLVVMVAIGSAFTYTERAMRSAETDHDEIEKRYTEAAKRIEQFQQLQEKQRTMAMQAELTSSLLEKVPRSFLLAEVTNAMPPGVSLLDLGLESRKRTAPAPSAKSAFEAKKGTVGAPANQPAGGKKRGAPAQPGTEAKLYDVNIKITGVASTDVQVAQFITRLNQSTLLRDVNLVISDEYKGDDSNNTMRKFQIEMMVSPNADVASLAEKPKVTAVEITK
jgi:Tfp pilus assembly protein PilN